MKIRIWLALVDEIAGEKASGDAPMTVDGYVTFYQEVNASVTGLWEKEGRHAYLHHLNALFGYRPLVVLERRLMKF